MACLEASSDWAWLPENIVDAILEKLVEPSDYVWFSAVCKQWHSVALRQKHGRIGATHHKSLPLLLVSTKDRSHTKRSLYSIIQDKVYYELRLNVPYDRRLCGSSHGWLAAVEKNWEITLINPFLGRTIGLPPMKMQTNLPDTKRHPYKYEDEVKKVILSSDPSLSPSDYVAVAIYGEFDQVAFIKSGDKDWTYVEVDYKTLFMDVIFFRGQIYALHYFGDLISIDIAGDFDVGYQVKKIVPRGVEHPNKAYIVESSYGDLLLVRRYISSRYPNHIQIFTDKFNRYLNHTQDFTDRFEILKLLYSNDGRQAEWAHITSIGDDALFLGDNYSMAVSTSNFSECSRNCIYYTDDYSSCSPYFPFGPSDMGIYNLEDGSFGLHYKLKPKYKRMPPALWVVPTLK